MFRIGIGNDIHKLVQGRPHAIGRPASRSPAPAPRQVPREELLNQGTVGVNYRAARARQRDAVFRRLQGAKNIRALADENRLQECARHRLLPALQGHDPMRLRLPPGLRDLEPGQQRRRQRDDLTGLLLVGAGSILG